jgi:CubicO group peptidase (beta-lactamase class C family)
MSLAENTNNKPDLSDLEELIQRFHVPGAAIAVWQEGVLHESAAGVANLNTKVAATSDTLFQIGSITKLYTTSLILQLVDEGLVRLDAPVRDYLPNFRVADEEVSKKVTVRHLLSHTSGIDGDYFRDAGRGEDRIEKFVDLLKDVPSIHPLGHMFAYCNVGFVVAGRIIEVVTGLTWDKAMRQRLVKPLGTPMFSTLPEQAIRYRTAIGHLGNSDTGIAVTPIAFLAQSNGPAGSIPMASAADLIPFARMLMNKGIAPNGNTILSPESTALFQTPQVTCPQGGPMDALGVGAFLWNWDNEAAGYNVFGHDGSTIGQAAFLRIHPASGTIVALLTNGGDGKGLSHALMTRIFSSAAQIAPPTSPALSAAKAGELDRYIGTYTRSSETAIVRAEGDQLFCAVRPAGDYAIIGSPPEVLLQRIDQDRFISVPAGMTQPINFNFLEPGANGLATYLYSGARVLTRSDDANG